MCELVGGDRPSCGLVMWARNLTVRDGASCSRTPLENLRFVKMLGSSQSAVLVEESGSSVEEKQTISNW